MDKAKVSLKEARADIQLKAGQPLEVETLRQAVVKAGFTPTWIRFEAIGHVVDHNGRPALKVQGTDQILPLVADEQYNALQQTTGKEGLVSLRGLIPQGEETAQIERFDVR